MKHFQNSEFKKLYNNFLKMFKEEGDVYGSLTATIKSDYTHRIIPSHMQKTITLQVLDLAAIEYFKKDIEIIMENDIIDEFGFE